MDVKEKILLTVVMTRSKVMELEAAAFREIAAMMDEEPPGSIALPSFASAPLANPAPDDPPTTEAPPAPEVATTTLEEPSAAPNAPETPPAPMPAEDPGPAQRRRGRPRKVIAEEAPSLLPRPEPPAEPVEPNEPAATPEAEPVANSDDDLPW